MALDLNNPLGVKWKINLFRFPTYSFIAQREVL